MKGSFYTHALIQPRKSELLSYTIRKALIDPGATLNSSNSYAEEQMNCAMHHDRSVQIRVANGNVQALPGSVKVLITVAGVPKVVQLQIVPGRTSYSIILGRPWLRSVNAVGYYGFDEYWITDPTGIHHQLDYSGPKDTIAPEIVLAEEVDWNTLRMDEDIINDLDH